MSRWEDRSWTGSCNIMNVSDVLSFGHTAAVSVVPPASGALEASSATWPHGTRK